MTLKHRALNYHPIQRGSYPLVYLEEKEGWEKEGIRETWAQDILLIHMGWV